MMENTTISKKSDVSNFPISGIRVATENNLLYDNFGIGNADDRDLTVSIQANGIQEPLTLSTDKVLLSGHRRFAAAKFLGLETVPVRITEVLFCSFSQTERLETLRRFNKQREKTPGERIREKLLDIDPDQALSDLILRRKKAQQVDVSVGIELALGDVKKRKRITTLQYLAAAKKVIFENKPYWPMTDRRIHYLLLNDPPLRHDKKPESVYINDMKCYKTTTDLLLRARLTGDIPWAAIEDETRPVQLGGGFSTFDQFVHQETQNFLNGYSRNLMQGQPHHIEIVLEKNALKSVIQQVASEYCIPMTVGKGFASGPPRHDISQRYRQSGKKNLVLLFLTDFDPDGEVIASSFARSMRDDFYIAERNITGIKVALNADDVRENDFPSDMEAKKSSPNYQEFIKKYGTKVVELDACPVDFLQSKTKEAILSVIDVDEFNAQIEMEKQDAANVEAHRRVVFDAMNGRAAA